MAKSDEFATPGPEPDRATIVAGASGDPAATGDDDLGMVLAPSVEREAEAHARAERRSKAPSTLPWPPRGSTPNGASGGADFGPYELMEEVGRGGMGVVYKARQKGLDRIVAVKMILGSHLASREQVARFYAEARAAAKLQDPRIVGIHDVGAIEGQHYFAMEYVAGPSLAQRIAARPMEPEAAARMVAEVARAIGRLHDQGVVHRDLKPSNILLDEAGLPCITDFGLAKMLSADAPATRTGAIVGTPSYMAPEQAAGRSEDVGPLSDVYALGAILYELLTGQPPFDEANPLDTLVQVLEAEPTPPTRLSPKLPRDLELICLKCLEKSPEARYRSAEALAEDLGRFLHREPVEARHHHPWQRIGRWARREPALVSRLGTLAICASILQVDQTLLRTHEPPVVRRIMVVLGLGVGASLIFQALLNRPRWSSLARYTWATADMILFATLVMISDALTSPLVAGFYLLVAASGLWFRERLVWYTTGLAVAAYASMIGLLAVAKPSDLATAQHHILFLVGLVVAGSVVSYQVKRVRALSHYYEHRPLP
jgi:serine/threonine-protein kinase